MHKANEQPSSSAFILQVECQKAQSLLSVLGLILILQDTSMSSSLIYYNQDNFYFTFNFAVNTKSCRIQPTKTREKNKYM